MDLEDGEMTVELGSTLVMVGEVNVIDTPLPEGVIFIDENSLWTTDELLALGTLLRLEKWSYKIKWPKEN